MKFTAKLALNLSSNRPADRGLSPEQRVCKWMIAYAVLDATHLRNGRPTWISELATEWLESDTDPREPEFFGSFTWCCHWLNLDPSTLRSVLRKYTDTAISSALEAGQKRGPERVVTDRLPPDLRPLIAEALYGQLSLFEVGA